MKMSDRTFVSFAWESFDGPWLSRQYLMREIAARSPVVYVTAELLMDAALTELKRGRLGELLPRTKTIAPNLVHLRPGGLFPRFYHTRERLNRWSAAGRARLIDRVIRARGWPRERLLYVWNPDFQAAFEALGAWPSIFHCVDYYPYYYPEGSVERALSERDLETCLRRADIVLTTCRALEDKLAEHVPRAFTRFLHGVDFAAFEAARDTGEPPELAAIPRPRLAHVGRINSKVDTELLAGIAAARPDWSVVLMGPVVSGLQPRTRAGLERFEALPNAFLLPGRPPADLPRFYHAVDVGLMAYRRDLWVPYIFPLKFLEFLAAGKPLVSTPIDSMREYPEFVACPGNEADWVAAIEAELAADSVDKAAVRVAFASRNSWRRRAEKIFELVDARAAAGTEGKAGAAAAHSGGES
jgi:glycosyltransferase involved in cell wall biosynthesis